MGAQLALDALPEWRTRDGIWPIEAHERGWVRLPARLVGKFGDGGEYAPGWVCCRCGGVEILLGVLTINHGCCFWPWRAPHEHARPCDWQESTDRQRRLGHADATEPGPFWSLWTPERPP